MLITFMKPAVHAMKNLSEQNASLRGQWLQVSYQVAMRDDIRNLAPVSSGLAE